VLLGLTTSFIQLVLALSIMLSMYLPLGATLIAMFSLTFTGNWLRFTVSHEREA
jgi:hypothetical protein